MKKSAFARASASKKYQWRNNVSMRNQIMAAAINIEKRGVIISESRRRENQA